MRRFFGGLLLVITTVLIYVLDKPMGALPAIGRLIDPVNGCWANAEPVNKDFSADQKFPGIKHEATVWIDGQMVPHIHAATDHDVYFIEGYIHAYFRLWQMDMQTRAAAGRVSEVVGQKAFEFDRKQRRKGMGFAAENSLKAMEADPRTKQMMDAYTEGVNNYISSLCYRSYPLEYKLMGFAPEQWTNLKSALLLKYMADDLTGATDDIALTYLRDVLAPKDFQLLFPDKIAGSSPAIPKGTVFDKPSLTVPAVPTDTTIFPHYKTTDFGEQKEEGKGSNNWAISGARTVSGAAILCNDPHLGLNLPSLWYAIQLQVPGMNVYGVSLPGTPGIVIGFNDSLSWGFTNNYRDVKDFYEIKPVEGNKNKYWLSGKQMDFSTRVEHITIKGKPEFVDTIKYTIHGPVYFDEHYATKDGLRRMLAICWMAYKPTNEMLCIYNLNRAKNYNQFVDAILNFQCPAQNMAYADRQGNIALWGQGQFVNKWKDQGKYVMDGSDTATLWKELIPMRENPHVLNPQQGYVCSANQSSTDSTYPYYYNGTFRELRAWRINQVLSGMQKASLDDMFRLQNETYSILAANTVPVMLKALSVKLSSDGNKYIEQLKSWDYRLDKESTIATFYQIWWSCLYRDLWSGAFGKVPDQLWPTTERTMQLLQDTAFGNRSPEVNKSYKEAYDSVKKLEATIGTDWYKVKNTTVAHLTKLPAFSYDHLKIGGWGNAVNAVKSDHGPSWRMVVQMGKEIEAYGVYPGGQSGNPGSKHYADLLQNWVDGKYYRLLFLPNSDNQGNKSIKYTWKVK
ncbi:MAG: acyl-homoserine-lactone acylase [Flavipsychrobacter sp.]|nr:acyl-homoserine-lactone acylase [Flavipsychrobacter sp.]